MTNYSEFEDQIGYKFKNINFLIEALTHSSASSTVNYDRMEFLGDSLISMFVAENLYDTTSKPAGKMSVLRSQLVSTDALSKIVVDNGWTKYIIFGGSILGAHNMPKKSLADIFESITAAIYLDSGYDGAKNFVKKDILSGVSNAIDADYKTKLQERLASLDHTMEISYKEIDETGPDHSKTFTMGIFINNKLITKAQGKSKKIAEQECAKVVYENIVKNGLEKLFN